MRIFQTLFAFGGNLPPQLAITRELVDRGHRVQVCAHRSARERVEATGAEFLEFRGWHDDADLTRPQTDPVRDWEVKSRAGPGKRMVAAVIGAMPATVGICVQALERSPADVVVFDFLMLGAAIAAERAAQPAAALVHCPYPYPVKGAPPLFSGMRPIAGPLGAARDRLLNRVMLRMRARGLPIINEVRAGAGLGPLARYEDQLLGADAVYVLTAPELDFSSRAALANVHYMGPSFDPYPSAWDSPWPETNADPLVVISFSTTYMNQLELAQRVLDAVAPLRVRALLTTGPAIDGTQLRVPNNARAIDFVPHRTLFPHASLVVSHCGWQTINAALADGVPLVCIPDGRDQPDNAARVLHVGAGVRASKSASPERLRATIETAIANPALKKRARDISAALARSDGTTATADAIEQLAAGRARAGAAAA